MSAKKPAKTLADFRAEHDPEVRIPNQIRAALESLRAEGPEAWEYDADFIKRCGDRVGNANIAAFRSQFEKHQVRVRMKGKNDKIVWFADLKVAAKARGDT